MPKPPSPMMPVISKSPSRVPERQRVRTVRRRSPDGFHLGRAHDTFLVRGDNGRIKVTSKRRRQADVGRKAAQRPLRAGIGSTRSSSVSRGRTSSAVRAKARHGQAASGRSERRPGRCQGQLGCHRRPRLTTRARADGAVRWPGPRRRRPRAELDVRALRAPMRPSADSQPCASARSWTAEVPAGSTTPAHSGNSRPTRSWLGAKTPINVLPPAMHAGIAQFQAGADANDFLPVVGHRPPQFGQAAAHPVVEAIQQRARQSPEDEIAR